MSLAIITWIDWKWTKVQTFWLKTISTNFYADNHKTWKKVKYHHRHQTSNMFFVVQKNQDSTTTTIRKKTWSRRRSRVVHVTQHLLRVVFPLIFVLISSSLITLVICSSSSSNTRRNTREIFDQDNKIDFLKIRVLHTNDLHSRFDEVTISGSKCKDEDREKQTCYGGVARLKYMVDSIRTQQEPNDNVLFLNAGDFFQVCKLFIFILLWIWKCLSSTWSLHFLYNLCLYYAFI